MQPQLLLRSSLLRGVQHRLASPAASSFSFVISPLTPCQGAFAFAGRRASHTNPSPSPPPSSTSASMSEVPAAVAPHAAGKESISAADAASEAIPQTPGAELSERRRKRTASSDGEGGTPTETVYSPLRLYAELSKARLSSLVVFTSGAGYLMAGTPLSWPACLAAVVGTSMAAAAAGTFNQVWEKANDGMMKRTQTRPLPSGKCSTPHALGFGAAMTAASGTTLLLGTNPLTAALGLGNVALYSLVYTPLKTRSTLNTAVGAIVGAIPPLMGWAAATGGLLAFEPMLLGAALFWWQFPHFYSLAWNLRKDYARGGYAMVPVLDTTGGKRTAWLSLRSAAALSTLPVVSSVLGVTSPMFAVEGVLLNAYFLRLAYRFWRNPNDATARALFRCSLWYLPVLLVLMVFHSRHWHPKEVEDKATADVAESLLPTSSKTAAVVASSNSSNSDSDTKSEAADDPRYGFKASFNAKDVSDLLQRGVSQAHAWGRALCVHELVVRQHVTSWVEAAQELGRRACKLLFASWAQQGNRGDENGKEQLPGVALASANGSGDAASAAPKCPFTGATPNSLSNPAAIAGAPLSTDAAVAAGGTPAEGSTAAAACPIVTVEKAVGSVVAQLGGGAASKKEKE